ncbi:MAG TPA: hypothetical protein VMB79_14465 [Jatrophihabitans sp.]|nr:hypothetical protein [Jatrophihabitans sp.]
MPGIPSFEQYLASLGRLSVHVDPTAGTAEAAAIQRAAESLDGLDEISIDSLTDWVRWHPRDVPVLGLTVGLSLEGLRNAMTDRLGTAGWVSLATADPAAIVRMLDEDFDLIRSLATQRRRAYTFGDVLVARGSTRHTAKKAGRSGRSVEDRIEAIAGGLGLDYETRTRFTGRNGQDAPCDLVVVDGHGEALVAVAAKGFDSTGSKLTDAVREVVEVAAIRKPRQYIFAVIDGIGWKSRQADLRRIHELWASDQIDGMYTLATLDRFRHDLGQAAVRHGLIADGSPAGPGEPRPSGQPDRVAGPGDEPGRRPMDRRGPDVLF